MIPPEVRAELAAHAREEQPNESCGLLVLRDGVAERYERGRNALDSPITTRDNHHPVALPNCFSGDILQWVFGMNQKYLGADIPGLQLVDQFDELDSGFSAVAGSAPADSPGAGGRGGGDGRGGAAGAGRGDQGPRLDRRANLRSRQARCRQALSGTVTVQ